MLVIINFRTGHDMFSEVIYCSSFCSIFLNVEYMTSDSDLDHEPEKSLHLNSSVEFLLASKNGNNILTMMTYIKWVLET